MFSVVLGVILQSKKIDLADGSVVNCLWISQDPEQLGEAARDLLNLTLASTLSQSICAQHTPAVTGVIFHLMIK